MPALGPTSMLDPFVEVWAKEAGMSTETLSSMFGGNILGGIIGIPFDMFLTQLGSKIAQGLLGVITLWAGTSTLKGQGRLQLDTMQVGSRIVSEILDPSPQQIKEIQRNVGDFVDGLIQGRWDKAVYAIFRNPREFSGILPSPSKPIEAPAPTEQPKPAIKTTEQPTYPPGPGIVMKL